MTEEEKAAHDALLVKMKDAAKQEIEARGYQNQTAVQAIVDKTLEGMPLLALRAYEADKTKTEDTLRNIAAELEKVSQIRSGEITIDKQIVRQMVTRAFEPASDGTPGELELMMRQKGNGQTKEVKLNIRAAATMTTTNTTNENNYPLEMIESMNVLDGVVLKRRGTQYIFDFANVTTVAELEEYTTWLEEGNEQGAFAIVAQGAVKPLMSYDLVRNFTKAKKVAGKMVVTEEFTKFRKKAWAAIQRLINFKVLRDYAAILTADLQALAASYTGTILDGTIAIPTDYDAIGAVAAQIETLNFFPDLLIIHPQDKWRLALEKDSQNRYYMMIPMYAPDGTVQMMGFRVLTSTYQTIGSFTLGESQLFQIEQEALTIRLGYGIDVTTAVVSGTSVVTSVASDFDTNKFRMIVENYFKDWLATPYIGSFVTASFATVKAALLKP